MSSQTQDDGYLKMVMDAFDEHVPQFDVSDRKYETFRQVVADVLNSALGEKDAEIKRLKDEHYAVCRGLAESILITVRKLAGRDDEIARLKASRQVMLTDEQLLAAYYSIDGRENASRTSIREERLRAVQAAIFDANKFSR